MQKVAMQIREKGTWATIIEELSEEHVHVSTEQCITIT